MREEPTSRAQNRQRTAAVRSVCVTRRRRGFVLVMTLVLIAVAGMLLVGVARDSMMLALEALSAQRDLQQRWGAISCQETILRRAGQLFEAEARQLEKDGEFRMPQPASIAGSIMLGGIRFDIRLADEDAKLNLNTLHAFKGKQQAEQTVRAMDMTLQGCCSRALVPWR